MQLPCVRARLVLLAPSMMHMAQHTAMLQLARLALRVCTLVLFIIIFTVLKLRRVIFKAQKVANSLYIGILYALRNEGSNSVVDLMMMIHLCQTSEGCIFQ